MVRLDILAREPEFSGLGTLQVLCELLESNNVVQICAALLEKPLNAFMILTHKISQPRDVALLYRNVAVQAR
jgi:hypothetical protein